jgi:hypothetical protein
MINHQEKLKISNVGSDAENLANLKRSEKNNIFIYSSKYNLSL